MKDLIVRPIVGIGDVQPGDDLAKMFVAAAPWLADGDVVVVTSKIVSKAEGSLAPVPPAGPEREAAKEQVLIGETARIVATRGATRIVATHHGFVMAAAGIDESNVDSGHLVLLPKDPDASARALRADLRTRFGLDVVIVVSDTMGRPWRIGLTDVALGVAGIDPLRDYRGERDAYGNELQITQMSPVDELAGAAELVKGKYDQVPVAVIRGLNIIGTPDGPGAAVLVRPAAEDMFSLGTAEARAEGVLTGLRLAARLDIVDETSADLGRPQGSAGPAGAAVDADKTVHADTAVRAGAAAWAGIAGPADAAGDAMRRALATMPADVTALLLVSDAAYALSVSCDADPFAIARAGAAIHAMRCALAADGFVTSWRMPDDADPAGIPEGFAPLGVISARYDRPAG